MHRAVHPHDVPGPMDRPRQGNSSAEHIELGHLVGIDCGSVSWGSSLGTWEAKYNAWIVRVTSQWSENYLIHHRQSGSLYNTWFLKMFFSIVIDCLFDSLSLFRQNLWTHMEWAASKYTTMIYSINSQNVCIIMFKRNSKWPTDPIDDRECIKRFDLKTVMPKNAGPRDSRIWHTVNCTQWVSLKNMVSVRVMHMY